MQEKLVRQSADLEVDFLIGEKQSLVVVDFFLETCDSVDQCGSFCCNQAEEGVGELGYETGVEWDVQRVAVVGEVVVEVLSGLHVDRDYSDG
jgi:hypothetical protein